MRKTSLILAGALCGAAVALVGTGHGPAPTPAQAKPASSARVSTDTVKRIALFTEVFERARSDFVENPDDAKLVEAAIAGLLGALDPHSEYLNAKAYEDMRAQTHGEFGGVGIKVAVENGMIKVLAPIEGTPAARAGIVADDIIPHLDGEPLEGLTLAEVADKMRGPVNTTVRLSIMRRDQGKPLQLAIVRDTIKVPSVHFHREGDDVGYIRITRFNHQTTDGLRAAIGELSARGAPGGVTGYILDMRNNPGGLIDQAVAVAASFLDTGEIVSLRGRDAA